MSERKPHSGFAGREIKQSDIDARDRATVLAHGDAAPEQMSPEPGGVSESELGILRDPGGNPYVDLAAWREPFDELREQFASEINHLRQQIEHGSDAQFARSLLDFNERLTRLEKQIAFMSSQQALAERQIELHKRATALDQGVKAAGAAGDAGLITGLADAFVIWLGGGHAG